MLAPKEEGSRYQTRAFRNPYTASIGDGVSVPRSPIGHLKGCGVHALVKHAVVLAFVVLPIDVEGLESVWAADRSALFGAVDEGDRGVFACRWVGHGLRA